MTVYVLRISDWNSDVCSSDLLPGIVSGSREAGGIRPPLQLLDQLRITGEQRSAEQIAMAVQRLGGGVHDQITAERQRPLAAGSGEGVVGDDPLPRRFRARRAVGPVGVAHTDIGPAPGRERGCE